MNDIIKKQHRYLAQLLEAVQRCAYFLGYSQKKITWPISETELTRRGKDPELFETLAAINEHFAKLQDTLASAMRHTALLLDEPQDNFLKTLVFFEKLAVLDSVKVWQQCRLVRNSAAHDYDLDYSTIADHFNTLAELTPMLLGTADKLIDLVNRELGIQPATDNFTAEFKQLLGEEPHSQGDSN